MKRDTSHGIRPVCSPFLSATRRQLNSRNERYSACVCLCGCRQISRTLDGRPRISAILFACRPGLNANIIDRLPTLFPGLFFFVVVVVVVVGGLACGKSLAGIETALAQLEKSQRAAGERRERKRDGLPNEFLLIFCGRPEAVRSSYCA